MDTVQLMMLLLMLKDSLLVFVVKLGIKRLVYSHCYYSHDIEKFKN